MQGEIPIIDIGGDQFDISLDESNELHQDHYESMVKIADNYLDHGIDRITHGEFEYLIYHAVHLFNDVRNDYISAKILDDLVACFELFYRGLGDRISETMESFFLEKLEKDATSVAESIEKIRYDLQSNIFVHRTFASVYAESLQELFTGVDRECFEQVKPELAYPLNSLIALAIENLEESDFEKYVDRMEQHLTVQGALEEITFDKKVVTDHIDFRVFLAYHETLEDDPFVKFFSFLKFKEGMMDVTVPLPSYHYFYDLYQGMLYFHFRNEGIEAVRDDFYNTSVIQGEFFVISDLSGMAGNRRLQLKSTDSLISIQLSKEIHGSFVELMLQIMHDEHYQEIEKILGIVYGRL